MTHLDLFTGIGGFHLAAEWAGFETIGFAEVEPYCCKLLTEKWPQIKNYGDIRNADFSLLRGRITVLSAGVPCQPASLAGKRRGKEDDRWLWPATLNVVGRVEPAWTIFENPVGILTLDEFGGILLRLESLGYQVRAFSVPANAVGAKHRRQRVFIVAHRDEQSAPRPCRETGRWNQLGNGGEAVADAEFRLTEPGIRLSTDGISGRLDETQGDAEKSNKATGQDLFSMRQVVQSDTVQRDFGRQHPFSGQEILQPEMHGLFEDKAGSEPRRLSQEDSASTQRTMRSLRDGEETLDSSYRSGLEQQRAREHPNPLLAMPPLTASPLVQGRQIRDRSAQLKALGNAVVPQVAFPFFQAIYQVEN